MVTEQIIQIVINILHGRTCVSTKTILPDSENPSVSKSTFENAMSKIDLFDELLLSYDIGEIESAISWLKLRGYLNPFGFGMMAPEMGYQLTNKGTEYAKTNNMLQEDILRLSGKAVSIKPSVYGISINLKEIWWRIKKKWNRET